jgi:hypothetical protein
VQQHVGCRGEWRPLVHVKFLKASQLSYNFFLKKNLLGEPRPYKTFEGSYNFFFFFKLLGGVMAPLGQAVAPPLCTPYMR